MFDRLTARMKDVMGLSRQTAQRMRHDHIGTEHVLLALIEEGTGVAVRVLKRRGFDLDVLCEGVSARIEPWRTEETFDSIRFTPEMRKVLLLSIEAVRELDHQHFGTEHLLLGLLRQRDGIAAEVLANAGVDPSAVRREVLELLGSAGGD